MTVVSNGYAAEAIDAEGLVSTFDDVGCMAVFLHDHAEHFRGARFFVQDRQTRAWVAADAAIYVRADDVPTPMNYGWHAFATAEDATAFAAAHGTVVSAGMNLELLFADVEPRRWRP